MLVHVGYENIQIRWKILDLTSFRTRKIKLNGKIFIQPVSTGSSDYFKQFWGVVPRTSYLEPKSIWVQMSKVVGGGAWWSVH